VQSKISNKNKNFRTRAIKTLPSTTSVRWFRTTGLHGWISELPVVRVPANILEKLKTDGDVSRQRLEAKSEAKILIGLPREKHITILYNLDVESSNLGELTICLLFAKYLANFGHQVKFSLIEPQLHPNQSATDNRVSAALLLEMKSLARGMSQGKFEFTEVKSSEYDHTQVAKHSHVLFGNFVVTRRSILTHVLILFGLTEVIQEFGDPKTLIKWNPSGFVGWHVRNSIVNRARNYRTNKLLLADAKAITRAFPANEIRIFTDDLGRARLENASKDLPELRALFDSGRIRFQESTGYLDATIEAARCEFWFQRLGGGIQIIPLFSLMPFLMLSEDIHVLRLSGGSKGKFYSWHHRGQVWQQSVAASFIPASPKLDRARLSETSFHKSEDIT